MKTLKRTVSVLLIMALLFGSMNLLAPAGKAKAASYTLLVGDVIVTSDNAADVFSDGGSVSFDESTQTLTLNNALIQDATIGTSSTGFITESGIQYSFSAGTFTIHLAGSNNIFVPYKASVNYSYGISGTDDSKAKVVFEGDGSLTVMANQAINTSTGIYTTSDTVIK